MKVITMYEYIHENWDVQQKISTSSTFQNTRPLKLLESTREAEGQRYRSQTLIRYAKKDRAALHSLCHAQVMRVDQRSCRSRRRSFLTEKFPTPNLEQMGGKT